MIEHTVIEGVIPLGGGIRITAYRRILGEVFGLPLIETINVDEYSALSCTTFERMLHENRLYLTDKVLDYAVFNVSPQSDMDLRQRMHEKRDWEFSLDISERVVDLYKNMTGVELPSDQLTKNCSIIQMLHTEEQELASISTECLEIESMFFKLTPQQCDPLKVQDIQRFLRRRRVDITRDEAHKQRHNVRVLLGLSLDESASCLRNSLSKSWTDWIAINDSVVSMHISDASFCSNRKQEFRICDRPHLATIQIGEKCFTHFVNFTLKSLPALTKLAIGKDCFNTENESGTFSVTSCSNLQSIQIDSNSFVFFTAFVLQGSSDFSLGSRSPISLQSSDGLTICG